MVAIIEEIQYLVSFNQAISGNLARAVSDMTGGILVDLANITLVRRDSYLANVRFGVKEDTLLALRTSPVHLDHLFDEELIKRAEAELTAHNSARATRGRDRPQPAAFASQSPVRPGAATGSNRSTGPPAGPRNPRKRPRKLESQTGQASQPKPSFKANKGPGFKCGFEAKVKK